jgi:hypothetical protein
VEGPRIKWKEGRYKKDSKERVDTDTKVHFQEKREGRKLSLQLPVRVCITTKLMCRCKQMALLAQ